MAIDFPNSPTVGQIFTVGAKTWVYDGTGWKANTASGSNVNTILVGSASVATDVPLTVTASSGQTANVINMTKTGTSSSFTVDSTMSVYKFTGQGSTLPSIQLQSYGTVTGTDLTFQRARGTVASPSGVVFGSNLGSIGFQGYEASGAAMFDGAYISVDAGEAWSATSRASILSIGNVAYGETLASDRLFVDQYGSVVLGWGGSAVNVVRGTAAVVNGTSTLTNLDQTFTADVSGTTLNVTAIGSGTYGLKVGMRILTDTTLATTIQSGVYIAALGTGTGGTGTYTLTTDLGTVASRTWYASRSSRAPVLSFRGTGSQVLTGDMYGSIEFASDNTNTNANGTRAFITAWSTSSTGASSLSFGTADASGAGATEKMRINNVGLVSGTGTSFGTWTSYTPTLAGVTLGTSPGANTASYCQIGKTVIARGTITLGTGFSIAGTGITLTFPVTPTGFNHLGNVVLERGSTTFYAGHIQSGTTANFTIWSLGTSGALTAITSTVPATWATGDRFRWSVTYEAA